MCCTRTVRSIERWNTSLDCYTMRCKPSLIQIPQLRTLCTDHSSRLVVLPKCCSICVSLSDLPHAPLVSISQHRGHETSKHGRTSQVPRRLKPLAQAKESRNGTRVVRKFPCHKILAGKTTAWLFPAAGQAVSCPVLPTFTICVLVAEL